MDCAMCGGKRFDKPRTLHSLHGPTYGVLGPAIQAIACLHCGWLALAVDPSRLGPHGSDWRPTDEESDKHAASVLDGMGTDGDPAVALEELNREKEAEKDEDDAPPPDPPDGEA
jgi:hypothetical protein